MKTEKSITEMQSSLQFIDEGPWRKGDICLRAILRLEGGSEISVGSIIYDRDENGNAIYKAVDPEGKELFPEANRLPQIKSQFRAHKDEFFPALKARLEERALDPIQARTQPQNTPTENVPSPYEKNLGKSSREKRLNAVRKDTGRNRSRTR